MYEDQIKRLREKANEQCFISCFGNCRSCEIEVELRQAADTIEELSVIVRAQKAVLDKFQSQKQ